MNRTLSPVLVTGSAGFIGKHLVKNLSEQGHNVIALYHQKIPEQRKNIIPVCSDMQNADLLLAPLRGIECVVHLAWEGGVLGSEKIFPDSQVTKNQYHLSNLIKAMESSGTRRIVFVSALGARRNSHAAFLKEKYQAEVMILNSKIPEKVILRPSFVFDGVAGQDLFLKSLTRLMRYPGFYPVPYDQENIEPVFVKDLVATIQMSVDTKLKEALQIVDVRGTKAYKFDELFKIVSQHYNKSVQVPIRGVVGKFIYPLFEHEFKSEHKKGARFGDYLRIGLEAKNQKPIVRESDHLEYGKSKTDLEDVLRGNIN